MHVAPNLKPAAIIALISTAEQPDCHVSKDTANVSSFATATRNITCKKPGNS